jgi:hypothetical protein
MKMNYEAAEVLVIGRAQDVILGVKTLLEDDNRPDPDIFHQDTALALFDE